MQYYLTLADGSDTGVHPASPALSGRPGQSAVRVRYADRSQVNMQCCSLDELVPADHPVRVIWQVVCELDLSRFEEPIAAREGVAGRPANDVRVMTGLWLWAAVQGVGSGRELAELCEDHVIFRWMCGGLSMNYHTLNDFRVGHGQALDELFTQVLGRLMHQKLVSVERITQDGMRTRASAGTSSFKSAGKLEGCAVGRADAAAGERAGGGLRRPAEGDRAGAGRRLCESRQD